MADRYFDDLLVDAPSAAKRLLGTLFIRDIGDEQIIGRIVETEAYDESDAASHSYNGRTPRTEVMFGPPGFLYVYFTYGMHYCCNVVCGPAGRGSAVLIRGIEPLSGIDTMTKNRGNTAYRNLTNGPAKVCQAFKIDRSLNGHHLDKKPLSIELQPPIATRMVVETTRIGIRKATEKRWRFYIRGSEFVSIK